MQKIKLSDVEIYTDGGCTNNPGEGGIGVLLKYNGHTKEIHGYVPAPTTNNKMELLAVIVALTSLKKPCNIKLYTDSKYIQQGITTWILAWKSNNWKSAQKKTIKNQALWKKLDELVSQHSIEFIWVKGHAGNTENELTDSLCHKAINNKAPILLEYLHLVEE